MTTAAPTAVAPVAPVTSSAPAAAPGASGAMTTAAAPAVTPEAAAPAAVSDWTTSLKDDLKGFVQNKQWKSPEDALTSYQNLEKLVGAGLDKIVKLPTDDNKDAWGQVYDKLGRPTNADGYKLDVPKEGGNPEFAKWAAGKFHELGLSQKQGQELAKQFNEYGAGLAQAQQQELQQKLEAGQNAIKKEWGAAYDQNVKVASRAAREFGVSAEVIDKMESVLGYDGVMKLFNSIGSKLGESSFVMGEQSGGALTPEAAKTEIGRLQKDPEFTQKYIKGDAQARKQMERLHQMAYYGEMAI